MGQETKNKNFRVLHIAFTLHDPMINQWLIRLLKKTKADNIAIDLMTTADEASIFQEVMSNIGGQILVCPHPKNKGAFLRYIREKLTSAEERIYDAVHVHPFIAASDILMQAFRANIPTRIIHAHADRRKERRNRSIFATIKHKMANTVVQRLATHGVAPDDKTAEKNFGANWRSDSRWQMMPYGQNITLTSLEDKEERKAKIKENLSLPKNACVIAQIAPFNFEKNHDLTLRLFEKESARNLSLYLILAGAGPLKEKIRQQILSKGLERRIILLDAMTDHQDILTVSDLLLMPSLYETDISVLIEAQLCRVPCLISSEIQQSDYLKSDLIHSLPIDGELDIWIKAVRSILKTNHDDHDDAIERLKNSPYDIDQNAGKFLGLYQQRLSEY